MIFQDGGYFQNGCPYFLNFSYFHRFRHESAFQKRIAIACQRDILKIDCQYCGKFQNGGSFFEVAIVSSI
jgi:hypothetical protein